VSGLTDYYRQAKDTQSYVANYIKYLSEILEQLDVSVIEKIIKTLVEAAERGSTIYLLGNGGSAATASHMANDLAVGAWMADYPPFRVVSLTDNVAIMTAIANDTDYSHLFVSQLRNLLLAQDIVLALSVSGNSKNVLEAVRFAARRGAITIGCSGFGGGELKNLTDIHLEVPSLPGEYGPVEDVMMILDHIIHSYLLLSRTGVLKRSHAE
jgi:D-sedoheptulose 7-phosphate isomerase